MERGIDGQKEKDRKDCKSSRRHSSCLAPLFIYLFSLSLSRPILTLSPSLVLMRKHKHTSLFHSLSNLLFIFDRKQKKWCWSFCNTNKQTDKRKLLQEDLSTAFLPPFTFLIVPIRRRRRKRVDWSEEFREKPFEKLLKREREEKQKICLSMKPSYVAPRTTWDHCVPSTIPAWNVNGFRHTVTLSSFQTSTVTKFIQMSSLETSEFIASHCFGAEKMYFNFWYFLVSCFCRGQNGLHLL